MKNDFLYLYIEPKHVDLLYRNNVIGKLSELLNILRLDEIVQVITNESAIWKIDGQICPSSSEMHH